MGDFGNYTLSNNGQDVPHTTTHMIVLIAVPCIVSFGLIGNALSILVLNRRKFRENTTSVFLVALSIADSVYLLTNSQTNLWVKYISYVDVRELSDTTCKILMYLVYVSKAYGSWILVAVNFERLISVTLPFKAKFYFTVRRAKIAVVVILAITLITYTYHLVLNAVYKDNLTPTCALSDNIIETIKALNLFSLIFENLLPCLCIITVNSVLCYIVIHKPRTGFKEKDTLGLSITLFILSITYMGLTLPISILLVYEAFAFPAIPSDVIHSSLFILDLTNSAINFVLYCISGSVFRKELKRMARKVFRCRRNSVHQIPVTSILPISIAYPNRDPMHRCRAMCT